MCPLGEVYLTPFQKCPHPPLSLSYHPLYLSQWTSPNVVCLGHLHESCAVVFAPLCSVRIGPQLFPSPPSPSTPHGSFRDICWKTLSCLQTQPCTGSEWVRFVLCCPHEAAEPRTGIWVQLTSEYRGCTPPSGKARRLAYLARCSWECLIVTFGSMTLARGREPPLHFEAFWQVLRGVPLSDLCTLWNLAPDSLIFKGTIWSLGFVVYFCFLFLTVARQIACFRDI